MKRISFFATIGFVALALSFSEHDVFADPPVSVRQQHPLSWMHSLPAGEAPGWSAPWWVNFEISNGNVWNAPLVMNDKKTGKQYSYMADFEQAHAILEIGRNFANRFGVGVEIPYAYRSGGMLDNFIDSFHVLLENRRFNRQFYPKYQDIYSVKTDGVEYYNGENLGDGVANINLKMKFWLVQWLGQQKASCPCGVSVSSQTKLPTQPAKWGGTTGDIDQSFMLHLGLPLFTSSAAWFTAGYTRLGDNPAMKEWPRNKNMFFYDMNLNFAFNSNWGLILTARAESPFLDASRLEYYDTATDPVTIARNRVASGWNSLVRWRGINSLGLSYRASEGNQVQFQVVEDWGIGPYDASDEIYSNNAPDVNFVLQTRFIW